MPRLAAIALALSTATAASASPIVLERLVGTGDLLPGTDVVIDTIRIPTINSHGQWAAPVSSQNVLSGVLGNSGYRIGLDQNPDGSSLTEDRLFNSVSLNDHGDLAVGLRYASGSSAAFVNGQFAAQPATVSGSIYHVDLNNGGYLRSTANSANFSDYYSVSAFTPQGEWEQLVFSGANVQTPVGLINGPVIGQSRAAVSNNGDLLYTARFAQTQPDGSISMLEGVALNDQFIALNGDISTVNGYQWSGLRSAGVVFNTASDYAFVSGLVPFDDDTLPVGNALFVNGAFAFGDSSFTENIDLSTVYENWSIDPTSFAFDSDHNVLWQAVAFGQTDPNVPTQITPSALMYNDDIIIRAGQLTPDGDVVWAFSDLQMSEDGSWGIVKILVNDVDELTSRNIVYRFQIPSPGTACLFILAGSLTSRRRR